MPVQPALLDSGRLAAERSLGVYPGEVTKQPDEYSAEEWLTHVRGSRLGGVPEPPLTEAGEKAAAEAREAEENAPPTPIDEMSPEQHLHRIRERNKQP
jgi:hypothetical protein